ncbi:MAG: hypothetical protein ACRDF4_01255 [Rhabdochlamydiaceae bacterium]
MSWKLVFIFPYILSFSSMYALFELYMKPCGMLHWCSLNWLGLDFYQYGFMFPLFIVVAIIPVIDQFFRNNRARLYAFATFLFGVLSEDSLYFVFARESIKPGIYTTQWGYLPLAGFILPLWYIFFAVGTILALYFASIIS